jgi:hypothetical protein
MKLNRWLREISRPLAAFGLAGACLTLIGCAGQEAPADRTAMLPPDQQVSEVPWNKPQGWENQGALGALGNDPRFGGSGTGH